MAELTKDSTIHELAQELSSGTMCRVLWSAENRERLAGRNAHSVGDLLTPEGETALYSLPGTGPKSMAELRSFLSEKGFRPQWPQTEARQARLAGTQNEQGGGEFRGR